VSIAGVISCVWDLFFLQKITKNNCTSGTPDYLVGTRQNYITRENLLRDPHKNVFLTSAGIKIYVM